MSKPDYSQIESHRVYWDEWGAPLGLQLRSFTDKWRAKFVDQLTGEAIEIAKIGTIREGSNFQFMDRLRTEVITLRGEV